jgi:divalent metal cation (Fe/Co/Zn/Cd) transporter
MNQVVAQLATSDRSALTRRGRKLESFTIVYNSLEGLVAVVAGLIAGSIALVGFGFDSVIEVASGVTLLWRLHADLDESRRERVEALALKVVGMLFLALALYVTSDSVVSLVTHEPPRKSLPGILLACASLIVMPLLTRAKRKVARAISSSAMTADAKQTELCTYLSAILLGGLLLNALCGWWWADPVAGLVMVPIIVKEGIDALRGETCCESDTRS